MTLQDIINQVRQRSDMEHTEFVKDAEITVFANQSYFELYDLLVSRYEDYFVTDFTDKVLDILSVTGDGVTTTVVCNSNHNLIDGLQITTSGWLASVGGDFNTTTYIKVVDSFTFTYLSTGDGVGSNGSVAIGSVINLSSGNKIGLPDDFYKLRGIDRNIGAGADGWSNVRMFNFADRNKMNKQVTRNLTGETSIVYRLFGKNIELRPEDSSQGFYRIWYIPRCKPLVNLTDTTQGIMDFEEYIIVDSAIKCLAKEESDTQVLMLQKEVLAGRIKAMASSRDANEIQRVADTRNADVEIGYYR